MTDGVIRNGPETLQRPDNTVAGSFAYLPSLVCELLKPHL